ncbi:MAG TPA: PAS domain S-box protein [Azospirillaceae bacterium]|nr:PAS domain S-box protein [Azospirillaceae bacterium]
MTSRDAASTISAAAPAGRRRAARRPSLMRILPVIAFISLLPLAAFEAFNAWHLRSKATLDAYDQAQRLLSMVEGEQMRVVDGIHNVLSTLRQTQAVRDGDDSDCQALMGRLRPEYPAYLSFYVTDAQGAVRCSTEPTAIGLRLGDREHIRAALGGLPFRVGASVQHRLTGRRILPFAMPVSDAGGRVTGAIAAAVESDWIEDYLARKPLPANASLTVADRDGVVLMRTPGVPGLVGSRLPDSYLALARSSEEGVREMPGLDGVPRLLAYAPVKPAAGLFVAVGIDKAAALAPISRTLAGGLMLLAAALAATLVATHWLGRRHLQDPIRRLTRTARRWRDGDLSVRAEVATSDLAPLADAFNDMAAALAARGLALEASEAFAHSVVESSPDCVKVLDLEGRLLSMNGPGRCAMDIEDFTPFQGQVWTGFWGEPDRPVVRAALAVARAGGTGRFTAPCPTARGVLKWWDVAVTPICGPDGLPARLLSTSRDITAAKEAETALRDSEARFRTVFEQAAAGFALIRPDGTFARVNRRFSAMLGYRADELCALDTWRVTHPDDKGADRDMGRALKRGDIGTYELEKRYLHKDGHTVWAHLTVALERDRRGGPLHFIVAANDVTERKQAETDRQRAAEELLRAKEQADTARQEAERANLAKSKFLAAASHDLRQPMQGAMLLASVLEGYLPSGTGREVLGHLDRSLHALKGLLDGLLDISRLDAGTVKAEPRDFPLAELLADLEATHGPAAAARGLSWSVAGVGGLVVRSDPTLLGRVVRNLTENALRYTPAGGHVRVACRRAGDAVRIEVRDTGIGIPADKCAEIFEEFVQIGNEGRDREQGLGLGLAIVRRLSRLLGHPVTVSSEPGCGSCFTVEVPLGCARQVPAPVPHTGGGLAGHGRTVLLVEDDALVALGMRVLLESWGYAVRLAASGAQALRELEGGRAPDLILSDYRLRDGETGAEVVRAVRARLGRDLPGIMVTGETSPEALGEAARLGLAVASKPVTARELSSALAACMEERAEVVAEG